MRLYIIRHGDPDYHHDALTEKGQREAALLSERLFKLKPDDFYVSPLGRARDTARPALKLLHKKETVVDWLQEFPVRAIDPYTGQNHVIWDYMPAFRAEHPAFNDNYRWLDDPHFKALNIKPLVAHAWTQLDALLKTYGYEREGDFYRVTNKTPCQKKVVFVCHLGIEMVLLSHLINIAAPSLLHSMFLPPSSVTTLCTEEREKGLAQFRTLGVGDTSHLYKGDEPISMAGFFEEFQP